MKQSFKFLIALVLLLVATQSVNAQFSRSAKRVPDRFHFGIRTGATGNFYTGEADNSDVLFFPSGGFSMDFQLGKIPLFLGIGTNYVNYGYKYSGRYGSETEDAHSVQVPIIASYHINVGPNVFINPFMGGFTAYNFNDDFYKQFNAGIRVGCGMNFGRFVFDLGYDMGLLNLGNREANVKTGTLFVTVGFNFVGSR